MNALGGTPCECHTKTQPFLVFDNSEENQAVKDRARSFWKSVEEHLPAEEADEQEVEELEEEGGNNTEDEGEDGKSDEQRGNRLWRLFLKMLSLRMDRHALAIEDGYRVKPQVCTCDDVCCTCFNYSSFLHNLKLHDHKRLILREYNKLLAAIKSKEATIEPQASVVKTPLEQVTAEGNFAVEEEEDEDYVLQPTNWTSEIGETPRRSTLGELVEWKSVGGGEFDSEMSMKSVRWTSTPSQDQINVSLSASPSLSKKYPSKVDSKETITEFKPKSVRCTCRAPKINSRIDEEGELVGWRSEPGEPGRESQGFEKTTSYWNVIDRLLGHVKRDEELRGIAQTLKRILSSPTANSGRSAAERPYETRLNSVHKRVREFDPDSYKTLVKREARELKEGPDVERKLQKGNRVGGLGFRPSWKI